LLLGIGLLVPLAAGANAYAHYGVMVRPGALPGASYLAGFSNGFFVLWPACAGFVLLLTPTGSLPSPRWRWWAWVAAAATAMPLVMAVATLAVAAAFQPARRRVQAVVDRRFNRRRYDASRTIAGFSARLWQEIDLDTLTAELLGVVEQTMQPTSVSLWLRPSASASQDQGRKAASRAARQPTPASRTVRTAL
jgi:hypothetical protein